MTGPDTPPVPPEPDDHDWPDVVRHGVTVMCEECGTLISVKNVAAYILANHIRDACRAMVHLNGDTD